MGVPEENGVLEEDGGEGGPEKEGNDFKVRWEVLALGIGRGCA